MQIQWHRLIALILVLILVAMAVKFWPVMLGALRTVHDLGPGHTTDEKTAGIITLGILGVLVLALVRILTNKNT